MQSAKLLRRFKLSATAYVLVDIVVLFLPPFVTTDGSATDNICRVGWNLVKLAFLLVLGWVFRPVEESNAYLQLGTYEGERPTLETHVRFLVSCCQMRIAVRVHLTWCMCDHLNGHCPI